MSFLWKKNKVLIAEIQLILTLILALTLIQTNINPIQSKLFWRLSVKGGGGGGRIQHPPPPHNFLSFNPNLMKLSAIDYWGMLYLLVVMYST